MHTPAPIVRPAHHALPLALVTLAIVSALVSTLAGCAVPVTRTAWVDAPPPSAPAPAATGGRVEHIAQLQTQLQPTGGGAVIGALAGGLIGSRFGGGFGRAVATGAGAVGGAVAGNAIEQNQAAAAGTSVVYRVTVRMDDGTRRTQDFSDLAGLQVGERVHFDAGRLVRG